MSEPDQPIVGIDLGTTFSVLAHITNAGVPATVNNSEGELLTPSALLFEGDQVVVGKEAAKALSTEASRVADHPKRFMGSKVYQKKFGGRRFPPEALQGWILNKLKNDAESSIGQFEKAVVTVPAYFDEVRRKATQDAGFIAGLNVIDIINEPTAAAIAFGFNEGWINETGRADQSSRVLVYDLGGGTFDVTVMDVKGKEFRAVATDGDIRLGGLDWDMRLVNHVAEAFVKEHGVDPREDEDTRGRLLVDCNAAKETLTVRDRASINCLQGSYAIRVEVTRKEFEDMTLDLLDRTDFTVRQTLKAAGSAWTDIDRVLLVGGSSRMPAVRSMIEALSGREPDTSLSPDQAVAHGAAIRSAIIQGGSEDFKATRIKNVNSHSLGVVATEIDTKIRRVVHLIPRNTPLPVVARQVFKIHKKNQESLLVKIVEGESENPDDCSTVGRCSIWDLPEELPVGTPIEVRFAYKENGRLKIKVKIGGDDQRAFRYEVERPNSLTQEQLDSWREYICG
jgi:molecular chaperone DnaK